MTLALAARLQDRGVARSQRREAGLGTERGTPADQVDRLVAAIDGCLAELVA